MTYLNAVKYINSAPEKSSSNSILPLLERLSSPHKRLHYVRLAGSNGKTVCAEMLMSVLKNSGYVAGYLKMPLQNDLRGNIFIGGSEIEMDEFASLTALVKDASKYLGKDFMPTRSELLLAVALLAFQNKRCDPCIIESDHFGADPSCALPPPFAAVICGTIPSDDASEISKIRSYIIRGTEEIVSVPQDSKAFRIISDTCFSANCRLTLPVRNAIEDVKLTLNRTDFCYKGEKYSLSLCGRFQVSNAVLAIETVEMLRRKGYDISHDAVTRGFSGLKIPAKFEVISLRPLILIDSTHTPVAIETVCDALADFKEQINNKICLCLPAGKIVKDYISSLTARGFGISKIIVPKTEYEYTACSDVIECEGTKALVKQALSSLSNDTMLLVSGDYPFVSGMRYEMLNKLGF